MKNVTLPDFLTDAQIQQAARIYEIYTDEAAVKEIQDRVIAPNLSTINTKLGQENDARYLAYMVVYVLSQVTKAVQS